MITRDLIAKLQLFPPEREVTLVDGAGNLLGSVADVHWEEFGDPPERPDMRVVIQTEDFA